MLIATNDALLVERGNDVTPSSIAVTWANWQTIVGEVSILRIHCIVLNRCSMLMALFYLAILDYCVSLCVYVCRIAVDHVFMLAGARQRHGCA